MGSAAAWNSGDLPSSINTHLREDGCMVCLEVWELTSTLIVNGACKHSMCHDCFTKLLNKKCPLCRMPMEDVNIFTLPDNKIKECKNILEIFEKINSNKISKKRHMPDEELEVLKEDSKLQVSGCYIGDDITFLELTEEQFGNRKILTLALIIDISGSMKEPLRSVNFEDIAKCFLGYKLTIITFNDTASYLVQDYIVTTESINDLTIQLQKLEPKNGTNLSTALELAINVNADQTICITDGETEHLSLAQSYIPSINIMIIGFGNFNYANMIELFGDGAIKNYIRAESTADLVDSLHIAATNSSLPVYVKITSEDPMLSIISTAQVANTRDIKVRAPTIIGIVGKYSDITINGKEIVISPNLNFEAKDILRTNLCLHYINRHSINVMTSDIGINIILLKHMKKQLMSIATLQPIAKLLDTRIECLKDKCINPYTSDSAEGFRLASSSVIGRFNTHC